MGEKNPAVIGISQVEHQKGACFHLSNLELPYSIICS